jgi:hypothetical protein
MFAALAVLLALAVVLAVGVATGVAFALAPAKGIDTSAWTSATGLNDLARAVLHLYLAAVGYACLAPRLPSSCARPPSPSRSESSTRCQARRSPAGCGTLATAGCRVSC